MAAGRSLKTEEEDEGGEDDGDGPNAEWIFSATSRLFMRSSPPRTSEISERCVAFRSNAVAARGGVVEISSESRGRGRCR
ncbi:hypothetical protein SDJN02_20322, partial [Cucurbita argyrosperma subsp. argyrosperma]